MGLKIILSSYTESIRVERAKEGEKEEGKDMQREKMRKRKKERRGRLLPSCQH